MLRPDRQATGTAGRGQVWFRRHQVYAWVGLLTTLLALGLGLTMWLSARLADRSPAGLLVTLHTLAGVIASGALLLAARTGWIRPNRPSLAQVVTRGQQWILQHRLLAFTSLACAAVMALTGGGALLGWLVGRPLLSLIYGHLITGIMLAPLVVATFLVGLRPVRRNRFGR